jgi:hypothetical protein
VLPSAEHIQELVSKIWCTIADQYSLLDAKSSSTPILLVEQLVAINFHF